MKNSKSLMIARMGITATLYVLTTVVFAPISVGPVQFRISEALCILPLVFPECAIGLTIGCVISNLALSTPLDVLIGGFATFVSGLLTLWIGLKIKNDVIKLIVGALPPILINALLVPLTFLVFTDGFVGYAINVSTVFIGQLTTIGTLGTLIYFSLLKHKNKGK